MSEENPKEDVAAEEAVEEVDPQVEAEAAKTAKIAAELESLYEIKAKYEALVNKQQEQEEIKTNNDVLLDMIARFKGTEAPKDAVDVTHEQSLASKLFSDRPSISAEDWLPSKSK